MESASPPLDSMFLVISFAILLGAVVYWLWSQIHMLQKETALVKSAVLDIQGAFLLLRQGGGFAPQEQQQQEQQQQEQQQPTIIYEDLSDENENEEEEQWPAEDEMREINADGTDPLEPGGLLMRVISTIEQEETQQEQVQQEQETEKESGTGNKEITPTVQQQPSSSNSFASSLDGMSTKELRRLAEQRGIQGVHDLKKKDLLSALRNQVTPLPLSSQQDTKSIELTVGEEILE
jgi:Rho termination factor, N-terminal domain